MSNEKSVKINAITFDRSIFGKKENFNLKSYDFKRLHDISEAGIKIVFSSVILNEMKHHFLNNVENTKNVLKKSADKLAYYLDIDMKKFNVFFNELQNINSYTKDKVSRFITDNKIIEVSLNKYLDSDKMFEDYFNVNPPFGNKESKKHEFPDSASLISLDNWSKRNNITLLIVSSDKGWKDYCEGKKNLVYVNSIDLAVDILFPNNALICKEIMNEICNNDPQEICNHIKEAIENELENTCFSLSSEPNPDNYDVDIKLSVSTSFSLPKINHDSPLKSARKKDTILEIVFSDFIYLDCEIDVDFSFNGDIISSDTCSEEVGIFVEVVLVFLSVDKKWKFNKINSVYIEDYIDLDVFDMSFELPVD